LYTYSRKDLKHKRIDTKRQSSLIAQAWWTITYLRTYRIDAALPTEENNLKPWVDDERLNDPFILGTFNTITNLIQKYTTLVEKLPDGEMPKTTSIPAMWKTVKDLKPESLKKLQHTIQNLEEALKLAGVDSKSNKEEEAMEEINTKKDDERSVRESGMNIESLLLREAAVARATKDGQNMTTRPRTSVRHSRNES
jgi:hypothetical protein